MTIMMIVKEMARSTTNTCNDEQVMIVAQIGYDIITCETA